MNATDIIVLVVVIVAVVAAFAAVIVQKVRAKKHGVCGCGCGCEGCSFACKRHSSKEDGENK